MPLSWFVETLNNKDYKINCFLVKKQKDNLQEDIEEIILIFEDITRNFIGNLLGNER